MPRILLVDDEFILSELTREYLVARNFDVAVCNNPSQVLDMLQASEFQLCVLDVRMPGKDGFTLATEIKSLYPDMPVIFLTGQTLKEDRIKGLVIGADDYIVKPFSLEELKLRITAVLKRYGIKSGQKETIFQLGKIVYNPMIREIHVENKILRLTSKENKLLQLLCQNLNQTVGRDVALNYIWGDNDIYKNRIMNVYITKLRNILKSEPEIEILNSHGEGYSLNFRVDNKE